MEVQPVAPTPYSRRKRFLQLFRRRYCIIAHRQDGNKDLAIAAGAKLHMTFDLGIDGIVLAKANAGAGVPFGAPLTNENISRNDMFAAKFLDAKTFSN